MKIEGITVTEYIIGNAVVVISRPELSEAERTKRENHIMTTLQQFGKALTEKE